MSELETRELGAASIATDLPEGLLTPADAAGNPVSPVVTPDFQGPVPTNEFYSSLNFPYFSADNANIMHAHPLSMRAVSSGLDIGYAAEPIIVAVPGLEKYEYSHRYDGATGQSGDLKIGLAGLETGRPALAGHGDWTATADWGGQMKASFGHGLPFVYVTRDSDADAVITLHEQPVNAVGNPVEPLTYILSGLNGRFDGSAVRFEIPVDAGVHVADGVQLRLSFDFDGDGRYDRVETYHFHPTDAAAGWEQYSDRLGLFSESGAMADMTNGRVKVELWRAIGDGEISIRTDSPDSFVRLPFAELTVDGQPATDGRLYLQGGATSGGAASSLSLVPHGAPGVDSTARGERAVPGWDGPGTVWYAADGVVGLTINGSHYGIFGPSGSQWQFTAEGLVSDLGGKDYFSVAVLPDAEVATLLEFHRHAYAFVTGSEVSWSVDVPTGRVETRFELATELMEQGPDLADTPLITLYRHQYINSDADLSDWSYNSARGELKVLDGTGFTTVMEANPLLPALPFAGDAEQAAVLRAMLDLEVARLQANPFPFQDTYTVGKELGRVAALAQIAHQVGHGEARDAFLDAIRTELADWFDATDGTAKLFYYNAEWNTLQGYPASFHTETQVNDHHFHYGYFIDAAATLAEFDPAWAAQGQYREIVNELIADAANWDRANGDYPFLRSFDPYAGHSWASGHGAFPSGNNQESASESLNFSSAVARWGAATGQAELLELGLFLHTVESEAVQQYWFDVDKAVFPEGFDHGAVGMVWSDGGAHSTWFSADPEKIHGINFLPATGGSLFLAEHPQHILASYAEILAERGGDPIVWKNLVWQYLALADPAQALAKFLADPGATQTAGETGIENGGSAAHTLHWLQSLNGLGTLRSDIRADTPFAAAFEKDGAISHVAYNAGSEARSVTFTDGTVLELDGRSLVLRRPDGSLLVHDYAAAGGGAGPGQGEPGQGEPGQGDPGDGEPGGGDPGGEDPGTGDPGSGEPGSGDPGSGDPGSPGLGLGADGRLGFGGGEPVALADAQGYTVNQPTGALTFTLEGLTGAYQAGGASRFALALDAGRLAGNGTQMRISYDFDGDGQVDRIESFDILPTDDLDGFETLATARLIQEQGAFADFTGGSVTVEIWNAFGPGGVRFDPAGSSLALPFALQADAPGSDPGAGDPGAGDPGAGDPGAGGPVGGAPGGGELALVLADGGRILFGGDAPALLAAAQGHTVNRPTDALTLTLDGLTGSWQRGGESRFLLALDAGRSVGNGTQLRLSYDFDGDGRIDRVESFDVLPTDDVDGFQGFATTRLIHEEGSFGDFAGGSLTVELWNAFGPGEVRFDPAASHLELPFDMQGGTGGLPNGDPGTGQPGGGGTGLGDFFLGPDGLRLDGAGILELEAAGGGYFVHRPENAVSFTATGLTGAMQPGGAAEFRILLDAGHGAANGTQVQLGYDFDGDGRIDRTEFYDVLPTDDLPGFQEFSTSSLLIAEGGMADFTGGSVTMTVWNAFGTDPVRLDPAGTRLRLPHDLVAAEWAEPDDAGAEPGAEGPGAGEGGAWTLYLDPAGGLRAEAPEAEATAMLAAATDGGSATFRVDGLTAAYAGGTVDLSFLLDAGQGVGNALAVELAFDFDGDGAVDRLETHGLFATDDLPGMEVLAAGSLPAEVSGSEYRDFADGSLAVTVRSAIGSGGVEIGLGGDLASMLILPYQGGWIA